MSEKDEKKGSIPFPLTIPGMPPGMPQPEVPWPDDIPEPGMPPTLPKPPTSVPSTTPVGSPADVHQGDKKKPSGDN